MRTEDSINDFIRQLKQQNDIFLEKKLADLIYIAQVEDIQFDSTLSLNYIKATKLHNKESVENIKISGMGLGNYSGIVKLPKINDFGLVIEVNGEPFWIQNVLDVYTTTPDKQLNIKESMLIQNKEAGSFMIFTKNDNVYITTQVGSKIMFKKDGTFKLLDNQGYGIESDGAGTITIRGNVINHTQTPGDFEIE